MLRAVSRFIRGTKAALLWDKAEQAATEQDYGKSLSLLRSIYDLSASEMPSMDVPYGVNMLCGNVASKTGDHRMAANAARMALRQIEQDRGLSRNEKDYLTYYLL